jgi:pyruvate carboxylase subunit B
MERAAAMRYVTQVEGKTFVIEVQDKEIVVDGQVHAVDLRRIELLSLYSLLIDNLSHEVFIEEQDDKYGAMLEGKLYTVQVQEERAREQSALPPTLPAVQGDVLVKAPMPGLVLEVLADVGQKTQAGAVLVVLESMKMRIELRCPQDGVVQAVHTAPDEHVTQEQVLVTVSP